MWNFLQKICKDKLCLGVVYGREEEVGNWPISARLLPSHWSKSTEGWLPILPRGIIQSLVSTREARDNILPPTHVSQ